jgi:hypothetical protein
MSLTEHDVQLDINRFFIDRSPTYLAFSRIVTADDGAGGKVQTDPSFLPNQRVRVVGQGRQLTTVTPDGRQVRVDLSLVGMPDLDVQIGDYFSLNDIEYEVINIQDQPYWRKIVEAIRRTGQLNVVYYGAFDSGFDAGFA